MSKLAIMLTLVTIAATVTGCFEITDSNNVKSKATYQNYRVTYDEDGSVLRATAEFDVGGPGGTSLQLSSPSLVTYNGETMGHEEFLGYRYYWQFSGRPYTQDHAFNWIDQDGKAYTNTIQMIPVAVSSAPSTFSLSGTYSVVISGPDVTKDDVFSLTLSQNTANGASVFWLDGVLVAPNTVQFKVNSSQPYVGSARVKVNRKRVFPLQQSTEVGGQIIEEYSTAALQVQVTQ